MLDGSWFLECQCGSDEHTLRFVLSEDKLSKNPDAPEYYCSIYLNQWRNVFKRIWVAIKYVFGYKCKYGHWDNWTLDISDVKYMRKMLEAFEESYMKWVNRD